ncbi:MAG: NUDIX domain-containing protein [Eubacteriales bacterium]|nr:NUDIX domain-containing protein [Eubacteriales bacterium]
MPIRNSAKAVVINDGKLLVNRCISRLGEYYALPGGGQRAGEMLTETVRRELLEETGYSVKPIRLSGIYERISEGRDDGMNHKIYFIFLCRLLGGTPKAPTEQDRYQVGLEWIALNEVRRKNLFPRAIRDNLSGLMDYGETIFIGSEKEKKGE